EHFHDAPVQGQVAAVGVLGEVLAEPRLLGDLVDGVELVGLRLVRPEKPEVVLVPPHDLPHQDAEEARVTGLGCSWFLDFDAESAEVRDFLSTPPLATGLALMRRVPFGGSARNSAMRRPSGSKCFSGS